MALMKLGIVATDIRGSVMGTVFSRNLGGAYTRGRVAPVNRNTPKQTKVRAAFAANAKLWSGTFTQTERDAWTFFAQANPLVNILGSSIIVSGLSMAQKLNQVKRQIGLSPITTPPSDLSVPTMAAAIGANADITTPTVVVNTDAQTVVAGAEYYIFATGPQAAGKLPQKNAYRFMGTFAGVAAATTIDITSQYTATFGAFITGQSIGILVATVNTDSGALTPGLKFNIIST
jgi:hypothetical protein